MEIDMLGTMLEEKGLSHEEIDQFFEHFGVKGMHWGQRRAGQKTAIVGGSIAGHLLVARFIGNKVLRKTGSIKITALVNLAGFAVGAIATAKVLDRHKDFSVSKIPKEKK